MTSDFEELVDELNKNVIEEMRHVYSEKTIELFLNPKNMGKIKEFNGYGKVKGPCGDTMEIFLNIKNNLIVDAGFTTDGCGSSGVCGGMITEIAKGKDIEDANRINAKMVLDELGGLPEADQHCARLAADTLHEAVTSYLKIEELT